MKIIFYTTNSNHYNDNSFSYKNFPEYLTLWENLKINNPNDEFIILIQKPAIFLFDQSINHLTQNVSNNEKKFPVKVILIDDSNSDRICDKIISLNPDIVIACTYWANPFDWMTIKDSIIAEKLESKGIKTICHSPKTAHLCFNKQETHIFLEKNNFNTAKSVYVHHEHYWAERNKNIIQTNIYKEYVHNEIKKLKFPVVIKDTTGLSSYGMDVVQTYNEAIHILNSKKNNGDRLVEEYIIGDSFGIEIYGNENNYFVSEVLINSVNQFGLTSPKQNVKLGPVLNEKFKINELKEEMKRLAKLLKLNGIAQVDLIYHDNKWYIVEINSRISGMTQTLCSIYRITIFELFVSICKNDFSKLTIKNFSCNLKFPLLSNEKLEKLFNTKFVQYVNQIENKEAKQLRETGYSEIIFNSQNSLEEIINNLEILNEKFNNEMEPIFYENTIKLYNVIKNTSDL